LRGYNDEFLKKIRVLSYSTKNFNLIEMKPDLF